MNRCMLGIGKAVFYIGFVALFFIGALCMFGMVEADRNYKAAIFVQPKHNCSNEILEKQDIDKYVARFSDTDKQ